MNDETSRTFDILLSRREGVETALTKLNKRAARKGLPLLRWEWGKAFTTTRRVSPPSMSGQVDMTGGTFDREERVSLVPLTLHGAVPKYAGWTFAAALQHVDGENIVRGVPGQEIPIMYRTRGPACDHCRSARRRNDTFVLVHEDGRAVQVGSSCVGDFLGSDEAGRIAALATLLASASDLCGDEGYSLGEGDFGREAVLEDYLAYVSWTVRIEGWTSKAVANAEGRQSTADRAFILMSKDSLRALVGCVLTEEDLVEAKAAAEWAENLSDAEVEKSDYLHNLRVVGRMGIAGPRTMGIAASAVVAYQKHLGRERQRAERAARPKLDVFLGTPGERVSFGLPAKTGKKGQPLKNAPTVLSAEPLLLDFVTGYDTDYGYTTILKFRTAEGSTVVWKSTNTAIERGDVGKRYTLLGTVKKHEEYKGEKQTVLSRCDVTEVPEPGSVDHDGIAA